MCTIPNQISKQVGPGYTIPQTHTHTHTHTHKHMHTLEDSILIHTHKYTMYTGTQDHSTCTHTYTHTHAHNITQKSTKYCTHTHTHTYIHTYFYFINIQYTHLQHVYNAFFKLFFRAMDLNFAICELAIATCIYGSSMYVLRQ